MDLAVRNLSSKCWCNKFCCLVSHDKQLGYQGSLPFKLALLQIATSFMEYADEIGCNPPLPPGLNAAASSYWLTPTTIQCRIEICSNPDEETPFLPEEYVDLIICAIAHNQAASAVCLGCQLPGHLLVDCNRFVDNIVAESLAQCQHPAALCMQIANSHSHFWSQPTVANACSLAGVLTRTVRSLQMNMHPTASSTDAPPLSCHQ